MGYAFVADIVGHVYYWQEYFNNAATNGFQGFPRHARRAGRRCPRRLGCASQNFLQSVEKTGSSRRNQRDWRRVSAAGFVVPFFTRESIGSGLLHGVIHSAHHLGR